MAEEEVGLRVSLRDRRETAAGLRDVDQGLDRVGRSAETSGRRARLGSKGFAALGRAAKIGFFGIAAGVGAVAAASVGFVKSAAEDQKSAKKLAVTLRNTTNARRRDVRGIEDWITAQGKALGVADDDLRPAISTLATATGDLTKARKLTTLANNIAVGKDKSLASVATALGKAYTGNVSGLGRLGIATKDAEGKTLTFDQVQRKLARTFNGQAAAAADTAAGKYDRFKLALSETGEAIGYELLPYASKLGDWLVDKGIPLVGKWGDRIGTDVIPMVERFVRKARPLANEVLPAVADGLGTLRDVAGKIAGPLERTFHAFNGLPDWAKSAIAIGAGGAVVAKKVGALSLGGKVASSALGVVKSAKPIPVFVTNPGFGVGTPATTATTAAATAGTGAATGAGVAATAANAVKLGQAGVLGIGALSIGAIFEANDNKKVNENFAAENKKALAEYANIRAQANQLLLGLPKSIFTNAMREPLRLTTAATKELKGNLDLVGSNKITVPLNKKPIVDAQSQTELLRRTLTQGIAGSPFVAHADLDASSAYAKLAALQRAASAVNIRAQGVDATPRAKGGPVTAGQTYLVGEHRPELFVPRVNGTIVPRVPDLAEFDTPVEASLQGAAASGHVTVISPIYLDKKQIGESVTDHYRDMTARA